ncbi:hypothetical protein [Vagococcus silagei]|uniref:hypothetical protein n=1 Tax=Vagococcus silagei TaxID=2508885 RepID=UPI0013A677C8|nr:hypothetical protein [Vagococcus silagei]
MGLRKNLLLMLFIVMIYSLVNVIVFSFDAQADVFTNRVKYYQKKGYEEGDNVARDIRI